MSLSRFVFMLIQHLRYERPPNLLQGQVSASLHGYFLPMPWQNLYFCLLPQGHGSFGPTFAIVAVASGCDFGPPTGRTLFGIAGVVLFVVDGTRGVFDAAGDVPLV